MVGDKALHEHELGPKRWGGDTCVGGMQEKTQAGGTRLAIATDTVVDVKWFRTINTLQLARAPAPHEGARCRVQPQQDTNTLL